MIFVCRTVTVKRTTFYGAKAIPVKAGPPKNVANHPPDENKIMLERFSDRNFPPPEKRRKIEAKTSDEDDEFSKLFNLYKK